MPRYRLPFLVIPLAALVVILPLILNGCSCGHDFDFHIVNWLEAASQFTHGNLHPHWAYTPAFNAGEPRFIFYPPLSWTIGAILGLILPWTWTPVAFTWLALTLSGLTLHRLAREFTTPTAALIAATFYIVNPYMLFTAYERTAYAELLAAAWIPLLLHAILRNKVTIPRIAIPIALLWLTNAPAAVMSCYTLALLTLIRLITNNRATKDQLPKNQPTEIQPTTNPGAPSFAPFAKGGVSRESATAPAHLPEAINNSTRLQLALTTISGTLLGLGAAAFYIVPAAYERRYVHIAMAILPGLRIQDNFLFHHSPQPTSDPFHDTVLHTASMIALTIIILTAALITITLLRTSKDQPTTNPGAPSFAPFAKGGVSRTSATALAPIIPLTILAITITFLLTPLSSPIWNHTPELPFLQFPWRFLAILAPVLSLLIAIAIKPLTLKPIATTTVAITIAATFIYPAYKVFRQSCDEEDTVRAHVALFHSNQGTDPTDEYTPLTADNDALSQTNPPYWLTPDPKAKSSEDTSEDQTAGPTPTHLTITLPTPQTLVLNLRDYPTWRITLNGVIITTRQHRPDGLIAIPIPTGQSKIDITTTHLPDQTIGLILTAISLLLITTTLKLKPTNRDLTTDN